jgi:hypothetical protein
MIIYVITNELKAYQVISKNHDDPFELLRAARNQLSSHIIYAADARFTSFEDKVMFIRNNRDPEVQQYLPNLHENRTMQDCISNLGGCEVLEI